VVSREYKYLSEIVKKYEVGILYDYLEEIPDILKGYERVQYQKLARNAFLLGQKLKSGYFFKKAIGEAISRITDSKN